MAIAFDAATYGSHNTGTSHSFSHTCTGADGLLFVGIVGDYTADDITSVTYNGDTMTLVDKRRNPGEARWTYLYYRLGPDTGGSYTVQINASSSHFLTGGAVSYTGAQQSGVPDASNTGESDTSPLTISVTTVANNCWTVLVGCCEGANVAAGTGSTQRVVDSSFDAIGMFDSAGVITPAGSYSMGMTGGSPTWFAGVMASFAPAGGGSTPSPAAGALALTGQGTRLGFTFNMPDEA
jgi:hypothetical protein